ncbi:MAG: Fic family protein [Actinomycetota bacterium]|nr:Fic family protein [Actinomycetota bacterium]
MRGSAHRALERPNAQPGGGDLQPGGPLIRAAIAHLNLVMVHPCRGGNGRMARLCTDGGSTRRARLPSGDGRSVSLAHRGDAPDGREVARSETATGADRRARRICDDPLPSAREAMTR